jgi:hypothetical protein
MIKQNQVRIIEELREKLTSLETGKDQLKRAAKK